MRITKWIQKEKLLLSDIGGNNMLEVLTGEASKGYKNKNRDRMIKIMYKYAQLKRFHNDRRLQVYMYAFMYF